MRRVLIVLVLASGLLVSACELGIGSRTTDPTGPTDTTPTVIDLEDPELLDRLGSPVFSDVNWRREIHGLTVLGSTASANPDELALLTGALEEVPDALLAEAAPRNLIRVKSGRGVEVIGKAVAFTKGPDIYLVDRTFAPNGDATTRFELARALLHELAHVAQYRALDDNYVQAGLEGQIDQVDPASGSTLVRSFAGSVGWIDESDDPLLASWFLPDSISAATDYGRSGAGEDMAEAVSMVALGRSNWIPATHTRWVEQWLGLSAATLARGKPWAPAGSREVLSTEALYDEEALAGTAVRFDNIEPLYFSLPDDVSDHEQLAAEIWQRLLDRRMSGVLSRTDDDRVPRYAGLFTGAGGVSMWVELWDFRVATGFRSSDPILTYVVLW